jgi:hypothetical protein
LPKITSSLHASMLADLGWANTPDRTARTAKPRAAFYQKFLDAHDGDEQRAQSAYRAHFKAMALKSIKARKAKDSK